MEGKFTASQKEAEAANEKNIALQQVCLQLKSKMDKID